MSDGLNFNGKHSYYDFKLTMEYFKPQLPQPKKILEDIPGMNGDGLDFSTIASGGEIVYTGRDLLCKFNLKSQDKIRLEQLYSNVSEWLLGAGKAQLIPDSMPGVFFMAQVQEIPTWDELIANRGSLEFKFRADPYKKGMGNYGDLLWDNIDFYLPDYIQQTKFNVNGSMVVTIGLPGSHPIIPTVVVDANMSCTVNGYTANFTPSNSIDWQFKLKPGINTIQISGTGNIDFQFRKEVL